MKTINYAYVKLEKKPLEMFQIKVINKFAKSIK